MGTSTPKAPESRVTICKASSELPARLKKLSWTPTSSIPKASPHTVAMSRSLSLSGAV